MSINTVIRWLSESLIFNYSVSTSMQQYPIVDNPIVDKNHYVFFAVAYSGLTFKNYLVAIYI